MLHLRFIAGLTVFFTVLPAAAQTWHTSVIDDFYPTGYRVSLAVDSDGNPHAVYRGGGGEAEDLLYA